MARRLNNEERALWSKVMATVQPLHTAKPTPKPAAKPTAAKLPAAKMDMAAALTTKRKSSAGSAPPKAVPVVASPVVMPHNLDGHWDRRIARGGIVPDVSIDLHDTTLNGAYARLDGALEQAIAQKFKVVLLVTGKPRAHDRASGEGRGAIAAVVRDWLAASRHARHISAVRNAHPRHGGAGAIYIMLKS